MSLALAIALVVLITEFILWFGYSQIASLVCSVLYHYYYYRTIITFFFIKLYKAYGVYLNAFERERVQKQRKTKRDILTIKHDLARTSSQVLEHIFIRNFYLYFGLFDKIIRDYYI
jgi:membrane protein implicated in regulation of membrane protease activity